MLQMAARVGNGQMDSSTLGSSASFALLSEFLVSPDIMAAVQDLGASYPAPAKQAVAKAKEARSDEMAVVSDLRSRNSKVLGGCFNWQRDRKCVYRMNCIFQHN